MVTTGFRFADEWDPMVTVTGFVELIVWVCVGYSTGYAIRHYLIDYVAEHHFGGRT